MGLFRQIIISQPTGEAQKFLNIPLGECRIDFSMTFGLGDRPLVENAKFKITLDRDANKDALYRGAGLVILFQTFPPVLLELGSPLVMTAPKLAERIQIKKI